MQFARRARQSNQALETLALEVLWQHVPPVADTWPSAILEYAGEPNCPSFEADRYLLLPPGEPDFL
ncbi:MAG: hypothetical protein ACFB9N_13820 [Geitlerinemataceae cyanobacterium]